MRLVENFESKILGNRRTLRILVPKGYEADKRRRYPVLYMHDGQNLFDGMTSYIPNKEWRVDETAYSLAEAGLVEPLIVVGIDNAGMARGDEYLPTKSRMGETQIGGKGGLHTRFIVEEVMPYLNKNFRTKTGPTNTGTCGSSFGGVIAHHMSLTRPDVFGRAAVVSPSLWWDEGYMTRSVKNLSKKLSVRLWTDTGTVESGGHTQIVSYKDALIAKGWKLGSDLAVYIEQGGQHNEDAWAKRFGMMLMFLFPAKR